MNSHVKSQGNLVMKKVNSHMYAFTTEDGWYSYTVSAKEMGSHVFFLESCQGRKLKIPVGHRYKTERKDDLEEGQTQSLLEKRLEKRAREVLLKEDGRYFLDRKY